MDGRSLESRLDQQQVGARAGGDLDPILTGQGHAVALTENRVGNPGLAFDDEGIDAAGRRWPVDRRAVTPGHQPCHLERLADRQRARLIADQAGKAIGVCLGVETAAQVGGRRQR